MNRLTRALSVAAFIMIVSWHGTAFAQMGFPNERHIHINGDHMDEEQIAELDESVGYWVPNGFYLVDFETGEWGYEGIGEVLGSVFLEGDPRRTAASDQGGGESAESTGRPYISPDTGTGSAVFGEECSYVSVGGTTMRLCD